MSDAEHTAADPRVLAIDIGGSHVKIMTSYGIEERRVDSGPDMSGQMMIDAVKSMLGDWQFDVVTMGYPGPVIHGKIIREPANLGKGWVGLDYETSFGKPTKIVNDALMQAVGGYDGGRMLFLGFGTGLGSAMIVNNAAQPMELAHLPYKKGHDFEHYVSAHYLDKKGHKKWRKRVFDVIEELRDALAPDYITIGGGNVEELDELPKACRRGDNAQAFTGGFRLWHDKSLIT